MRGAASRRGAPAGRRRRGFAASAAMISQAISVKAGAAPTDLTGA
jgi:hypothetical protein